MASFRTPALLLVPLLAPIVVAQGLHIGPQDPATQPATQPATHTRPHTRPVRPHPIIIRHPRRWSVPVTIKSLAVKTNIVDGVATTELKQVFHNGGPRIAEATWILPLPPGAIADTFSMSMNGKQVSGEVINARRARQIYLSIVRRQKDPGLLEYLGNGCLRARVFPIPAKSDMTVQVRYRQVLPQTAGLHEWSFPLRAAHVQYRPPQKISMDVRIKSTVAIKNVYSPTGNVDVMLKGDHEARVTLELSAPARHSHFSTGRARTRYSTRSSADIERARSRPGNLRRDPGAREARPAAAACAVRPVPEAGVTSSRGR